MALQPFLPEHVPPPEPPKKNGVKTLALWLALIVLFLVIWTFLSPDGSAPPKPALPPCEAAPWWSSALTTFGPAAFLIFLFVFLFLRPYRASAKFNSAQEPGAIAMAEGRFGDALAIFRRMQADHAKKPLYRAVTTINIANAHVWSGQLDEAIAGYVDVERTSGAFFSSSVRLLAATDLAVTYALTGELEAAERWMAESRKRLAQAADERLAHGARLCLAEAIVMCRRGAHRDAIALLDAHWPRLRHTFNGNWMRVVEVVRAFAEAQGGLREQNVVGERLVRVEPVHGDELAFIGARWPEMRAFLVAHRLASIA